MSRRRLAWLLGSVAAAAVLVVGGTWAYIHVVEGKAPARLALSTPEGASTSAPATGSLAGTWRVGSGSQAGYRVKEVLFGQSATAVGRTTSVTGTFTVTGTTVTAASFSVDLASVASDQDRRDNQFRGRIMDVSQFPAATFRLTSPVTPPAGAKVTVAATGDLTLHGTTKAVTVTLEAQRNGAAVEVVGSIPVVFGDYGIPSPSFGPAEVEDHGEIEVRLVLRKSS